MDAQAFEIAKGSWGPDAEFTVEMVKDMLEANDLKIDFSPEELKRIWERS